MIPRAIIATSQKPAQSGGFVVDIRNNKIWFRHKVADFSHGSSRIPTSWLVARTLAIVPVPIRFGELASIVYAHDEWGGPLNACSVMRNTIMNFVRPKLANIGINVRSESTHGIWLEAA